MAASANEAESNKVRLEFEGRERALEHEIDHQPLEMHLELAVKYNVRIPHFKPRAVGMEHCRA